MVTAGIEGFCKAEEKPLGPLQLYVMPGTVEVVSISVEPVQIGVLAVGVGAVSGGVMLTVVIACGETQPAAVIVKLYTPALIAVTPGIEGFWVMEVKALGPVQA